MSSPALVAGQFSQVLVNQTTHDKSRLTDQIDYDALPATDKKTVQCYSDPGPPHDSKRLPPWDPLGFPYFPLL